MTGKEYWDSLNEMYGTDIEMPKDLEKSLNMDEIAFDMAMGKTFDGASQKDMD